jgi:hypothetical protein
MPRVLPLAVLAALTLTAPSAMAQGGLKPSQAPQVTVGQHYFGSTAHPANNGSYAYDLWRLPAILAGDVINVAWSQDPSQDTGLCLSDGVDDFDWADYTCNAVGVQGASGSNSTRSLLAAPRSSANAFLEFFNAVPCCRSGGAYDFTVEAIQHRLALDLPRLSRLRRTSVVRARGSLASGRVPDGVSANLTVSWRGGRARYRTTSRAGALAFKLRLPASARGKTATLSVSRGADAGYLAARSASKRVRVR